MDYICLNFRQLSWNLISNRWVKTCLLLLALLITLAPNKVSNLEVTKTDSYLDLNWKIKSGYSKFELANSAIEEFGDASESSLKQITEKWQKTEDKNKLNEAFFKAIEVNDLNQFQQIIQSSTELSMVNSEQETLLMRAASLGRVEMVTLLIERDNGRLGFTNRFGENFFHLAVLNNQLKVVDLVLNLKLTQKMDKTNEGANALMLAAHMGHIEILDRLLKSGSYNLNEVDRHGSNTLMYAISSGQLVAVQRLLQEPGLNLTLKNDDQKTAFDLAQESELEGELLKQLKPVKIAFKVKSFGPRTKNRTVSGS